MEPEFFIVSGSDNKYRYNWKDEATYSIQKIYMNMHQIDPSLNKVMALIYIESYSEFIKNKHEKHRVPNTNILANFISIDQNTFRKEIISNEYLNLIKSFFLQFPNIIDEKCGNAIFKIEKGFLSNEVYSPIKEILFHIEENISEEELKEIILNSIPKDQIKDFQFTESEDYNDFMKSLSQMIPLFSPIMFPLEGIPFITIHSELRLRYGDDYLLTNKEQDIILHNNPGPGLHLYNYVGQNEEYIYFDKIIKNIKKNMKSLYNFKNEVDIIFSGY